MKKCKHRNIEVVIEIPKTGTYQKTEFQKEKKYVICVDCGKQLPIDSITQRIIEVDMYD